MSQGEGVGSVTIPVTTCSCSHMFLLDQSVHLQEFNHSCCKLTGPCPLLLLCLLTAVWCSRDGVARVGLARFDVNRQLAALVGGNPYRFASMLQASWPATGRCGACCVPYFARWL